MSIEIVDAKNIDAKKYTDAIPEFVWLTGPDSYGYQFVSRSLFDKVIKRSWDEPGTLYYSDSFTLALENDVLVGMELGLKGRKFTERQVALGHLMAQMAEAGEIDQDDLKLATERGRIARWLNPVISPSTYYLAAVAVTPNLRGQKLGLKLFQNAVEKAKAMRCRSLQLDVLSDNPAVDFYRAAGMEVLVESRIPPEHGIPPEYRMGLSLR